MTIGPPSPMTYNLPPTIHSVPDHRSQPPAHVQPFSQEEQPPGAEPIVTERMYRVADGVRRKPLRVQDDRVNGTSEPSGPSTFRERGRIGRGSPEA